MSNVPLYLQILESEFIAFLARRGSSEKTRKNYKSDIRHFWNWLFFWSKATFGSIPKDHYQLFSLTTNAAITQYRAQLASGHTPAATINRRLSSLRILFTFCTQKGLIDQNPLHGLTNLAVAPSMKAQIFSLLEAFGHNLVQQGASKATIRHYVSDVEEFLMWTLRQTKETNG